MTERTWRCHACQTFNEPGRSLCQVCSEKREPQTEPASAKKGPTWRCHACDTYNLGSVAVCELCGVPRDVTRGTKAPKAPPRKSKPTPPKPKKTTSRTKVSSSTGTATGRSSTSESSRPAPPEVDDDIFFPPMKSTASTSAPTSAPTGAPATGYGPPPPPSGGWHSPGYAPPTPVSGGSGCGKWLVVVFCVVVAILLQQGCSAFISSITTPSRDRPTPSESSTDRCPTRVADLIADEGGERVTLMEAYETEDHRIILCEDDNGQVYYHGETRDSDEDVLLMRAESTSNGYLARNEPYGYEITGDEVIVTNNGEVLRRATLTPWDDPE